MMRVPTPRAASTQEPDENIPKLAEFTFAGIDEDYPARARDAGPHAVVAGDNYGQGSSREHAAITPRYLGLALVLARSFARIHWQNLANFGVLACEFTDPEDRDGIEPGDVLELTDLRDTLPRTDRLAVRNTTRGHEFQVRHRLSPRQVEAVLAGSRVALLADE